jgi:beta-galactosidase
VKNLVISLLFLFSAGIASAQVTKMDNVLYGAAYYQEYMPTDRLAEDLKLMKESGMSVVRVGESTWSLFEPREGEFEFAWMDRIIDGLHANGIKVILGTPTYSIPAWLWHKHPEVLVNYEKGGKAYYGIRQNMDITNPTFLFYSERIIRKMMEHYAKHPAIIGYQVDNETTSYNVNNYDFHISFVDYLKKKFGNTEKLNKIWGLNYWGMTINGWDELPGNDGVTNTAYKLEWERFKRKSVADYLTWQANIVSEYRRPEQFITHCFMPAVQDIDQVESTKKMDVLAVNVYHGSQDNLTGDEIAFSGDFFRSVKMKNYLITETNAQTIGWDSKTQMPPYDGQLRMNVYAHMGSGANMVEYWHWHSIHYGQETYWKGVLSHDLQPNRAYTEYSKTAHELQKFGNKLVNLKITNKVAILFSHDANAALKCDAF